MLEPSITAQIGGYLMDFKDSEIVVKVGRLDVHKDGRVTGELTISTSKKAILLSPSSFNFSSSTVRKREAKDIAEKYQGTDIEKKILDKCPEISDSKEYWVELFDYLGIKVQELARQGEPVREIWAADEAEAPEFLLEPFIYKNQPNIMYGAKGTLKSSLSQAFAMCMALPWHDNPLGLIVPDKPIVSLVLDWETDEKIFAWSLSRLKRGMGIPAVSIQYRRCYLPLAEELEEIEHHIDKVKADFIIIDSLAAAASGERGGLNEQSALSFNMALRKLNRTSFIIAQTSKDQEGRKTILGSVIFEYYARNIFELCRSEDMDSNRVHSAIFHRECNLGRKHKPMGFCMDFNDDNRSLSITQEAVTVSEFINKVGGKSAVADALKSGLKTVGEIAEKTGLEEKSIRTYCQRLKEEGKVTKVGDRWGLKAYHQDDMEF